MHHRTAITHYPAIERTSSRQNTLLPDGRGERATPAESLLAELWPYYDGPKEGLLPTELLLQQEGENLITDPSRRVLLYVYYCRWALLRMRFVLLYWLARSEGRVFSAGQRERPRLYL